MFTQLRLIEGDSPDVSVRRFERKSSRIRCARNRRPVRTTVLLRHWSQDRLRDGNFEPRRPNVPGAEGQLASRAGQTDFNVLDKLAGLCVHARNRAVTLVEGPCRACARGDEARSWPDFNGIDYFVRLGIHAGQHVRSWGADPYVPFAKGNARRIRRHRDLADTMLVAGSIFERTPFASVTSQTPSGLAAIPPSLTAGPTGTVAITLFVLVSILDTAFSPLRRLRRWTQTAPNPAARPAQGRFPTVTTAATMFVLGSSRLPYSSAAGYPDGVFRHHLPVRRTLRRKHGQRRNGRHFAPHPGRRDAGLGRPLLALLLARQLRRLRRTPIPAPTGRRPSRRRTRWRN